GDRRPAGTTGRAVGQPARSHQRPHPGPGADQPAHDDGRVPQPHLRGAVVGRDLRVAQEPGEQGLNTRPASAGGGTPSAAAGGAWSCVPAIERYLDEYSAGLTLPENLRAAIRYSLLGSGKRLRPVLAWQCCVAAGGKGEESLAAGAAVELVHAF